MIELLHDGYDISNLLVSYNRQQEMCSGIGTLDLVLVDKERDYFPWDSIELYEGGSKRGEYYIVSTDDDANKGTITISAQDGSKKLSDYFVDDRYEVEGDTSARSLITKYLNMAGASYSFTAGDGVIIGKGASFGLSSVFEIVTTLLQYSGWYMYFNPNNTCIIGTLDTNPGSGIPITDATILYLKVHKNDDMLRNKAVVWGGTEYPNGSMVHVSKQTITPWNYDENDLRAVVISNGMIRDYASANTMANRLMQEFPHLTIEKEINIAGITTLEIGSSVNVNSRWWKGSGLVTTNAASFSAGDGFQTNIILDQRCPRLFGFWKEYPIPNGEDPDEVFDYVYIGTGGDGVWRKPINGHTWSNYSEGLTDLVIKDLFVKDGIAVCVGKEGEAFIRSETDEAWTVLHYGPLEAYELFYYEEELKIVACSIGTSTVVLGVNYSPWWLEDEEYLKTSFVVCVDYTTLEVKFSDQVEYIFEEEGEEPVDVWNIIIHDLEVMGSDVVLSIEGYPPAYAYKKDHKYSFRSDAGGNKGNWGQENNAVNTLTIDGQQTVEYPERISYSFGTGSSLIMDENDEEIMYHFSQSAFYVRNLNSRTVDTYPWDAPLEWGGLSGGSFGMLRQRSNTEFDLVIVYSGTGFTNIYYTDYTIGDEVLSTSLIKEMTSKVPGFSIIGNSFTCTESGVSNPEYTTNQSVFVYNLDSKSGSIYTNWITTHVYDPFSEGGPDPPEPVGWVQTYQKYKDPITAIIPGDDYITFGRIYTVATDWHSHPNWLGYIWLGWTTDIEITEVRGAYVQINRDGSVSQSDTLLSTHESPTMDGSYVELISVGDSNVSTLVGTGGTIYQAQLTAIGSPDKTQAMVVTVNEEFGILAQFVTPWINDGDYFWDDRLLREVPNSNTYSVQITGDPCSETSSSKYFGTKFIKAVAIGTHPNLDRYFIIQGLDLTTCRIFREDLTTPDGTEIYDLGGNVDLVGYTHTRNDDDNDGTIYFEAKRVEDDVKIIIGIKINGGSYSINKEINISATFGRSSFLFNEWLAYFTGTAVYLTKGFSIGDPSKILKYSPIAESNKFIPIKDTGFNSTIEINKNAPIEAFHKVSTLGVHSNFLYQNFSPSVDDWSDIEQDFPIYDLRTCDITDFATFTVASGDTGTSTKWCILGTKGELKAFPTELNSDSIIINSFDGNVANVETTNFNGNPYLFVAISGLNILGEGEESGGGFFQRGQNEIEFVEQSSGLPLSGITIIRVDDRL
jgi:hypothetical protein